MDYSFTIFACWHTCDVLISVHVYVCGEILVIYWQSVTCLCMINLLFLPCWPHVYMSIERHLFSAGDMFILQEIYMNINVLEKQLFLFCQISDAHICNIFRVGHW
jgi:hypothetical protein